MSGEPVQAGPQMRDATAGATAPSDDDERRQHVVVVGDGNIAETAIMAAAASIYLKAFLETLGQRTGESVASLSKRILESLVHRGKAGQITIPTQGGAVLVFPEDLPDEARLALLDLDVTAEDVRGKTLRWDNEAKAWRTDTAHEDLAGHLGVMPDHTGLGINSATRDATR